MMKDDVFNVYKAFQIWGFKFHLSENCLFIYEGHVLIQAASCEPKELNIFHEDGRAVKF